jgi:hypothetical protein
MGQDRQMRHLAIRPKYSPIRQSRITVIKLSRYTPWRHMGGEEVQLLLILKLGTRWG